MMNSYTAVLFLFSLNNKTKLTYAVLSDSPVPPKRGSNVSLPVTSEYVCGRVPQAVLPKRLITYQTGAGKEDHCFLYTYFVF